ncbi:hypothetical protein A2U01_0006600 [Trifolium medium]|uniref:Transmembrane protein n=1 Tax=Trifolium medium TaxID=97028 RepID=A0A392ME39_9FABA|nr:hypothetical protein [Trifolium medium]
MCGGGATRSVSAPPVSCLPVRSCAFLSGVRPSDAFKPPPPSFLRFAAALQGTCCWCWILVWVVGLSFWSSDLLDTVRADEKVTVPTPVVLQNPYGAE